MGILSITNYNLRDKIALLRVDFNVPIINSVIKDSTRILRVIPTIRYLVESINAKVVILSHLGRPKKRDSSLSLRVVVDLLSKILNKEVNFVPDCIGKHVHNIVDGMTSGDVVLLENLRFYPEEEYNDITFAKQLASIGDLYVNDAFSCSHRAHSSIVRITEFLPSYAGLSMVDELMCLEKFFSFKLRPVAAIVGGSKISTKLKLLTKLAEKVDYLIVGGAIANNFLLFNEINIGKSLFQEGVNHLLNNILPEKIIMPTDIINSTGIVKKVHEIMDDDVILDIGPQTIKKIANIIAHCKTVLWNGPIGVFEDITFANGTIELMNIISNFTKTRNLISIIGGGDSLSAIKVAGLATKDFTYVSTAGGAFLSWLSGDEMPGISALENR
ncbi:phosphoglycerate kinase [Wolbachia pipientis]|uniref:Phosphoglycerate kinase n=1 Tax=Wolbachia pipientis TaxID=955 RepID=A0A1E7QK35_WOLPI|nr:phosphoglycerate kinase [Wolbachia pipientis]OEY86828.1 phosphoglycerate kinase [Wolbachia pipientis]